jgi:membrane protein DedA with SNARE-associated domain
MIKEYFQEVVNWVALNPGWAGLIIFAISLAESLIVVGLFIPGILVMGAVGGLVGSDVLSMGPTLMWAILGAVCGDGISYWVGYTFKDGLEKFWIFRKFPNWLARGREFFLKHGSKSIVVGRFVGPVRPFIPAVAGIMSMSPRNFFVANVISALLWAPVYMLPGYSLVKIDLPSVNQYYSSAKNYVSSLWANNKPAATKDNHNDNK